MPPENLILLERQRADFLQSTTKAETLLRLRSAEGHLRVVIAMVEAEEPCQALLHELGVVQAALRAARWRMVDCQYHSCVETIIHDPCAEKRLAGLTRLSNLIHLLIHNSGS
jgi:hypothetical protein NreA